MRERAAIRRELLKYSLSLKKTYIFCIYLLKKPLSRCKNTIQILQLQINKQQTGASSRIALNTLAFWTSTFIGLDSQNVFNVTVVLTMNSTGFTSITSHNRICDKKFVICSTRSISTYLFDFGNIIIYVYSVM